MSLRSNKKFSFVTVFPALLALAICTPTFAAGNGTWNAFTPGTYSWDTPGNWVGSNIADGAGSVATFSTSNPSGITINLTSNPRTIGTLVSNSRADSDGWVFGGPNTLTLNNGANSPLVQLSSAVPTNKTTISTAIDGTNGFTVSGTGTLSIAAPYANTFTGPSIINSNNTLNNTAILSFDADNANVKAIQFGVVTTAGTVNTAGTTTGSLNVNANVTATNIVAQSDTGFASNFVSIAPGKTLTLTGNGTSAISVGYDLGSGSNGIGASGGAPQMDLVFSGNVLDVEASGQSVNVGANNTATASNTAAVLDFARLNNLIMNLGSTGKLNIGGDGSPTGTGTGNRTQGVMALSNVTNTITAGAITVGGGSNSSGVAATMYLGKAINNLNADTFYVGTFRSTGTIAFNGSFITNVSGSLRIRGSGGTDADRAAINLGATTDTAGSTAAITGTAAWTGHPVDVKGSTLTLGARPTAGPATGTLSFDNGVVDVNGIVMAQNSFQANTATTTVAGTINVGGIGVTPATTSQLIVGAGGINLGSLDPGDTSVPRAASTQVANGTLNVGIGGTATIGGDIVAGYVNTGTPLITVQGGTLNMQGHNIGPTATPLNGAASKNVTITATSGTMMNLGTINNILASGTTALTKTGAGTLTLAGTNTYAGDTVVNATNTSSGLVVNGSLPTSSVVTVTGGTLGGSGNGTTTGIVGNVTLGAGARIAPGATLLDGDIGTLTVNSLTVNGGDLRFDLSDPTTGPNDLIASTGAVTFTASPNGSTISLGNIPKAGTYSLITAPLNAMTIAGGAALPAKPSITNTRATFSDPVVVHGVSQDSLQFTVTGGAKTVTWTGGDAGLPTTWDLSTTQNWSTGTGSTTVPNDKFFNLDTVVFTDSPATPNSTTVSVVGSLQPESVTVTNSAGHDFTFNGAGDITGNQVPLTKNGTGNLLVNTANTLSGITTVNGGKLILSATGGLASSSRIIIGPSGTLQFGNADAATNTGTNIGLGTAPIVNNNLLILNTTANAPPASGVPTTYVLFPNVISGGGTIEKDGTGSVVLSGSNIAFTGPIVVNAGTLAIGGSPNSIGIQNNSPITVNAGATLSLDSANGTTGAASGPSSNALSFGTRLVSIAGDGVGGSGAIRVFAGNQQQNAFQNIKLTANASIQPSGRMDIKNGVLDLQGFTMTQLGGQLALTSSTVTDGNIVVNNGATLNMESAIIQGNGTITFNSGSTWRITGAAPGTVTRPIAIAGNTTITTNLDTTGLGNSPLISANLPSTIGSNMSLAGNLTITSSLGTGSNTQLTFNGNITQDATPRSLTLQPNGTTTNFTTVILNGTNTFSGGITFNASARCALGGMVLQVGSSGALNSAGVNSITFNATASNSRFGVRLNGFNQTVAGLFGASAGPFIENSSAIPNTLTVLSTSPSSFQGTIQDAAAGVTSASLSLTKTGPSTLSLTGTNTYTGPTNINGGKLEILSPGSLANLISNPSLTSFSAVSVNAGGTLSGTGTVGNVTMATPTSILAPGSAASSGILTMTGLNVSAGELQVGTSGNSVKVTNPTLSAIATFTNGGSTSVKPNFNALPQAGTTTFLNADNLVTTGHTFTVNVPSNTRFATPTVTVNPGANGSLSFNLNASSLNLTWTGANSSTWDLGNVSVPSAGTQNWSDNGGVSTNQKDFNLDGVTFDDTASPTARNVNLSTTLFPFAVNVNTTGTYTFSGTGSLAGFGGVNVNNGKLVIANSTPNTYSGVTNVAAGATLVVNGTLFSNGLVSIANGGALSGEGSMGDVNIAAGGAISVITPGNTVGTLSMNSMTASNTDIQMELPANDAGGTHDKIAVATLASLTSTTFTLLNPTAIPTGTTTLVSYATHAGTPTLNIPATTRANYHFTVGANAITINPDVTALNLTWTGSSGTNAALWDLNTTTNFSDNGSGTANQKFFNLDAVSFTDAAPAANQNVVLNATIQPSNVNVNTTGTYTLNGTGGITGPGGITMTAGKLVVGNSNTYTGNTTLNGGVLALGSSTAIYNGLTNGTIVFNGGVLQYTTGGMNDASAHFSNAPNQQYKIDVNDPTAPNSGIVTLQTNLTSVGGSLTKSGPGKLIISSSNTYTGDTIVSGGTLELGGNDRISDNSRLVMNGGRFATAGGSEQLGALVVSSPSTIDLGTGSSTLTFANSTGATWSGITGALDITNWTSGSDHVLVTGGGLLPAQVNQIHFGGYRGLAQLIGNELSPTAATATLLRGDLTGDGLYKADDLDKMLIALTNPATYEAGYTGPGGALQPYELPDLADVNQDGVVDNLDIQAEISTILSGTLPSPPAPSLGGGAGAVPEPASFVLLALGGLVGIAAAAKNRRRIAN